MKLTYTQRQTLKDLARGIGVRKSCTNSTLCALERRGLVRLEFVPHKNIPDFTVEHWSLTDDGHTALTN